MICAAQVRVVQPRAAQVGEGQNRTDEVRAAPQSAVLKSTGIRFSELVKFERM